MLLNHLRLYHFNTCPYCIKVRLAMKVMGIKIESKNIHADPQAKAELIAEGGKKQVPCLRIKEGDQVTWLYESSAIIDYLKQLRA